MIDNKPPVNNVLFLCTGNSARSSMAEAILNKIGAPRYRAFSAGSHPKEAVHPEALRLLARQGYETEGLHPKSWEEFRSAPAFTHIVTVCSNVAGEACPVIPGSAKTLHWEIPNPAAIAGKPEEVAAAFRAVYDMLYERIEEFVG
ncbi:MAG TPA: arsenate reductase ArsC [Rhizomicrobium sp.]|jgi:protein-tyrosine-phosphatase|nr:arsenate reductase ArsC [Rhizomicrobium sp.]